MQLPVYQVDAFTSKVFGGNPAAIVPLDEWLDEAKLQSIAAENNLSETAFFVPEPPGGGADFALRWFTPKLEVDLCGHATFATAWLLFNEMDYDKKSVSFITRSGVLIANKDGMKVTIDLPVRASSECECPTELAAGLYAHPVAVRSGANLIAVFETEAEVASLNPDFRKLAELHPQGVIATAPGNNVDVVSRFFGPSFGIDEDPVTGSAHADLAPYWVGRLGKNRFSARQISQRAGELDVCQENDRVYLTGEGSLYLRGEIIF